MSDKKQRINDLTLQYLVLIQILVEIIEELEGMKFFVGQIKMFIKNAKNVFEKYIDGLFRSASEDGEDTVFMASKLLVMKERVEKALLNEYVITVDERRQRTLEVLSKYTSTYLSKEDAENIFKELEEKNLFNF